MREISTNIIKALDGVKEEYTNPWLDSSKGELTKDTNKVSPGKPK